MGRTYPSRPEVRYLRISDGFRPASHGDGRGTPSEYVCGIDCLTISRPPPLNRTNPVEVCVDAFVDAIETRSRTVFVPGWVSGIGESGACPGSIGSTPGSPDGTTSGSVSGSIGVVVIPQSYARRAVVATGPHPE